MAVRSQVFFSFLNSLRAQRLTPRAALSDMTGTSLFTDRWQEIVHFSGYNPDVSGRDVLLITDDPERQ